MWSLFLQILAAIAGFFTNIGRELGRKEYQHDESEAHDERVAEADAARADADAIAGVHDPFNRDNR